KAPALTIDVEQVAKQIVEIKRFMQQLLKVMTTAAAPAPMVLPVSAVVAEQLLPLNDQVHSAESVREMPQPNMVSEEIKLSNPENQEIFSGLGSTTNRCELEVKTNITQEVTANSFKAVTPVKARNTRNGSGTSLETPLGVLATSTPAIQSRKV